MRITFELEDEVVRGISESIVAEAGELSDHMATLAEYLLRQVYLRTAAERELDTDEVLDLDEIRENLAIMAQPPSHAHPRAVLGSNRNSLRLAGNTVGNRRRTGGLNE